MRIRYSRQTSVARNKINFKSADKLLPNFIDALYVLNVPSSSQVLGLIALANQNRSTAQTAQNDRSSRSHSVFQLDIEGVNAGRDVKCKCEYNPTGSTSIRNVVSCFWIYNI